MLVGWALMTFMGPKCKQETSSAFCHSHRQHLSRNSSLTIRQIATEQHPRKKNHDDSPKYHSNVNFQPSKSDKSIDFDVSSAYISNATFLASAGKKQRIICRGFSISFNSIKPITNIHIYHKMVKDLVEGKERGFARAGAGIATRVNLNAEYIQHP